MSRCELRYEQKTMPSRKRIALVAHDHKKDELLAWAKQHRETLSRHALIATGTTGTLLERDTGLPIEKVKSGPLGGDLEIGARITNGEIDCLLFFWDPLEAQPHDPDVRALLRVAVVWNIPVACGVATADFLLSSPHMNGEYHRQLPDYSDRATR